MGWIGKKVKEMVKKHWVHMIESFKKKGINGTKEESTEVTHHLASVI
jgi:hypothetical protein